MENAFIMIRQEDPQVTQQRLELLQNFAKIIGLHVMHEQILNPYEEVTPTLELLFPCDVLLIDDLSALGTAQEEVSNALRVLVYNDSLVVVVLSDDEFIVLDRGTVSIVEMFRCLDVTLLPSAV